MHELTPWLSGTPHHDPMCSGKARFVELAYQRRNDVRTLQVEIVSRPVEVGGHQADSVETVLAAIGLNQLNACDFGDGIPLIRWLERTRQKGFFRDGLRCEPRVDARRPKELQFFYTVAKGRMNDVHLNRKIVVDETGRQARVRQNSADLCSSEKYILRPLLGEKLIHLLLVSKIQLGRCSKDEPVVSLSL